MSCSLGYGMPLPESRRVYDSTLLWPAAWCTTVAWQQCSYIPQRNLHEAATKLPPLLLLLARVQANQPSWLRQPYFLCV